MAINYQFVFFKRASILLLLALQYLNSTAQISKLADNILLQNPIINSGHIGISIYEPATNKYLYNYNATKYFVPASNTKLFTLYAGMKYLGDSLPALKYKIDSDKIIIQGTGDPTLLHDYYTQQPVIDFLKKQKKSIWLDNSNWQDERLGNGWPWDDYGESFNIERSAMPIYGNLYKFYLKNNKIQSQPIYQHDVILDLDGIKNKNYNNLSDVYLSKLPKYFSIKRANYFSDIITIQKDTAPFTTTFLPRTINEFTNLAYLKDSVNGTHDGIDSVSKYHFVQKTVFNNTIYSQPVDSLFKPMMYDSDNFFAEQTLLMVSNKRLDCMNDKKIIDLFLQKDFKNIPQTPVWVDGSGLSRYDLFTPQCFIYILNKLKNEFGLERMKRILPTGGTGTLKNYFINNRNFIFAKTGSMSNQYALSGYLITKQNKLLIFSILTNNFEGKTTPVRKLVERFVQEIRDKY